MDTIFIDINCDVGEGTGLETELMPLISSCNIACGGHAGNLDTIAEVARSAKENGVKVGAHPSYPDTENFGRVSMSISEFDLTKSIRRQIDDFASILKKENIPFNHIKAHGALYNDIAKDSDLAKIFVKSIEGYQDIASIYVPYGSAIEAEALQRGFQVKYEGFADRNYNRNLSLVSRKLPEAVITDPEKVLKHLLQMVREKYIATIDGLKIYSKAETFCVHDDTPSVVQILNYLSLELPKLKIQIKNCCLTPYLSDLWNSCCFGGMAERGRRGHIRRYSAILPIPKNTLSKRERLGDDTCLQFTYSCSE